MPNVIDGVKQHDVAAFQQSLLIAAGCTQRRSGKVLFGVGANIWATYDQGNAPAQLARASVLALESQQGRERTEFIGRLRQASYPRPPYLGREKSALGEAVRRSLAARY